MKDTEYIKKKYFQVYDGIVPVFRIVITSIAIAIVFIRGEATGWKQYVCFISGIFYIIYFLAVLLLKNIKKRILFNYYIIFNVADIILISLCVACTGGAKSPLYLFYIIWIVFFSLVYEAVKSFIIALLSVVCYVGTVLLTDHFLSFEIYIRIIFFLLMSFFTVYIYEKVNSHTCTLATRDSLTKLYNQQFFYSILECILSKSERDKSPVSLAIMDLDNFKTVNDKYGHLKGDRVLIEVSSIIKDNIRSQDIAARYGGDEIVIVLPQTDKESAVKVCFRIKDKFQQCFKNKDINITLSVGIATFPHDAQTPMDLFHAADKALYKAKKGGKNIVEY